MRGDGPSRMVRQPTGSGGEPSSPNCGASAGVKARHSTCSVFASAALCEKQPCRSRRIFIFCDACSLYGHRTHAYRSQAIAHPHFCPTMHSCNALLLYSCALRMAVACSQQLISASKQIVNRFLLTMLTRQTSQRDWQSQNGTLTRNAI